ncbi:MAG: hypothetical protein R6U62_04920 [Bacteroidales bacterium]
MSCHGAGAVRWLDLSLQLQAGLGRPAIYKKGAVVAAALGLRTLAP